MEATRTGERPASLRDAQRNFTRARICDAARELFFVRGYGATTIDEIAKAAGASRSTLYTHFRDKDEILDKIADEYIAALCEVVQRLPGPTPTRAAIDAWLLDIAAFIRRERTPTIFIDGLSNLDQVPPAVHRSGNRLIETLALRLPAFQRVLDERANPGLATAWASVVMRELGFACLQYSRDETERAGRDLLVVASYLFHQFVHERRV